MVKNGWAVAGWGVGFAGFGAGCALSGTALFGASWVGWLLAAVGVTAVGAGIGVVRGRPPRRLLRALCGPAAVAAWGLLMDVLALLFGQAVDSVPGAVQHVLGATGALLLAAAARRPGGAAGVRREAAVEAAPANVQVACWIGTTAFLPYVVMKLTWAFGGSFAGLSGDRMYDGYVRNGSSGIWLALERWGLDGTALLAAVGVFLLWGLVRPWGQVFPRWTVVLSGRRVPRWLPLAPALVGAATLVPYGLGMTGYLALCTAGVVEVRRADFGTGELASTSAMLQIGWVGAVAFAGFGLALAVATRSYWRRTAR
ncbi:hypothetical protein [Streptomyces rubellomurinus]|uniref:Uncharacterized protein n=2 Tax=Streptomyces TaxID=1883 RepID=A0A0F2TCG3_STRR3|nr:hypothetical protein [Streptomyces rubellomurinus]KJS60859.1 hypothetical protein VM95_18375 [Streptomyces rubellomurinus]